MRMSKLVGRRIKEAPKDAKTQSHIFLIRGGYIRPVSAGIYSILPIGKRILDKIEKQLSACPECYPVRKGPFAGLRKMRMGHYRIIYAIAGQDVLVLRIGHRRNVYE